MTLPKNRFSEAAHRAWRTVLQGAIVTALVAGVAVVHDALSAGRSDYRAIALTAATAALTAVVSYVHKWLEEHKRTLP